MPSRLLIEASVLADLYVGSIPGLRHTQKELKKSTRPEPLLLPVAATELWFCFVVICFIYLFHFFAPLGIEDLQKERLNQAGAWKGIVGSRDNCSIVRISVKTNICKWLWMHGFIVLILTPIRHTIHIQTLLTQWRSCALLLHSSVCSLHSHPSLLRSSPLY